MTVGTRRLERCTRPGADRGQLERPLDPEPAGATRQSASLVQLRWIEDLEVAATLLFEPDKTAGDVALDFRSRDGRDERLRRSWPTGGLEVSARVAGQVRSPALAAEAAAPSALSRHGGR